MRVDWLELAAGVDSDSERGRWSILPQQRHPEDEELCSAEREASLASHSHVSDETDRDHDEDARALGSVALERLGHLERERLHLIIMVVSCRRLALDVDVWVNGTRELGSARL